MEILQIKKIIFLIKVSENYKVTNEPLTFSQKRFEGAVGERGRRKISHFLLKLAIPLKALF